MKRWITPNTLGVPLAPRVGGLIALCFLLWELFKPAVFPTTLEIVTAIPGLWNDGLGFEVLSSLWVNIQAILLSTIVGLPLCYMTRIPILTPVTALLAKLRFAGSAVFYLPLLLTLDSPHWVKVNVLALGSLFYLVTSMSDTIQGIEEFRYDDARTLKMGEWLSIWYVNIRGTIPEAFDAVRANAGMGWSMLMFVEGALRSEGGVGIVLLNAEKHVNYDEFFAVVLVVIGVGIVQDWLIGKVKEAMCPYA